MPQSRKRPGHPYQKPADIPSSQRIRGRVTVAILVAIFGLLIAFFASNGSIIALAVGTLIGAVAGYFIGKKMEQAA